MKKPAIKAMIAILALTGISTVNAAETETVAVRKISSSGIGEKIGEVRLQQQDEGVLITPQLKNLKSGLHGFHVHENPSCKPAEKDGKIAAGIAAGDHFDPDKTGEHKGPFAKGHLGDLPALFVDKDGNASHPVFAPRLKLNDLRGHALMIHAGGDTYSEPPKLGGGGDRVACGVIGKDVS